MEGIPRFVIKVYQNLRFETFHCGPRCSLPYISKNRLNQMNSWSLLENIITSLNNMDIDHKKEMLLQQVKVMAPKIVGEKTYPAAFLVMAFCFFATSRALYNRLREDYVLPSVSTLTNLTSKVSKITEGSLISKVVARAASKVFIVLH